MQLAEHRRAATSEQRFRIGRVPHQVGRVVSCAGPTRARSREVLIDESAGSLDREVLMTISLLSEAPQFFPARAKLRRHSLKRRDSFFVKDMLCLPPEDMQRNVSEARQRKISCERTCDEGGNREGIPAGDLKQDL